MAIDYYTLSGTPTSIEENLLSNNVKPYDMFLVSKFVLSNVSPFRTYESNGTIYRNEYWSMHTTYDSLSNQLYDDLAGKYGFKSMAWENSAHYSLIGHIHNYSIVSAYSNPLLRMNKNRSNASELVPIVTFSVDSKKTDMYMPYIHLYEAPKPYIGQLKFLAKDKIDAININAADFDGWTYPDGKALLSDDFPEAWNVFGTTYGSDSEKKTFNLPNLRNFIKFADSNSPNIQLKDSVHYNVIAGTHNHALNGIAVRGDINVSLSVRLTQNDSGNCCMHDSHGEERQTTGILFFNTANLHCVNPTLQASDEKLAVETYPTYNLLPVLMYIGERKKN